MAVDGDFVNFRAVYDELTDEVERARYQFIPDHLRNWFRELDTTPRVSTIVARLQSGLNFDEWWRKYSGFGMAGAGRVEWPNDPEKALGMRLLLFRAFSEGRDDRDIAGFGVSHINVGTNLNDNAQMVIEQIFRPMARELRRYIEQEINKAPAADRVVKLDHNSAPYRDALDALEKLERVLQQANDYPDAEDKEQRVAEVSATKQLLKSVRVRVTAVVAVIGSGLTYLATHFVGTAIDTASHSVIEKLTTLFGAYF